MTIHDYLTDDGYAVLTLCSSFALPADAEARGLDPLRLAEWNQIAKKIAASAWQRPAELHGKRADDVARELSITTDEAERLARLLDRTGPLSAEMDQLFSRGIWAVTRMDPLYPSRLRDTLKQQAAPVLFGCGDVSLLGRTGVAVVGSRNIDETGAEFAREVGRKAVRAGMTVISGGARGTDRIAMDGALQADGMAVGALADSLEATVKKADVRQFIEDGRLTLVTCYAPDAGFSVGAAMGRNKMIYGLSEYAVVVSSEHQSGGTWAGAVEALKGKWCPVFVRKGETVPKGNTELLKLGGVALDASDLAAIDDLRDWMASHAPRVAREQDLFS